MADSISSKASGKHNALATSFTGKPGLNHGNTSLLVVSEWLQLRWLLWLHSIVSCCRLIKIVLVGLTPVMNICIKILVATVYIYTRLYLAVQISIKKKKNAVYSPKGRVKAVCLPVE